jgi:hypothetical protein
MMLMSWLSWKVSGSSNPYLEDFAKMEEAKKKKKR